MHEEQRVMSALWPAPTGGWALDLACGSGRYSRLLAQRGVTDVVAVDFCPPMLARVRGPLPVCADMMRLPFGAATFGVIVSGLAVGHAPDVVGWMAEMARLLTPGGALLYSDFHPEAARAGLPRSFTDGEGRTRTVPHRSFDVPVQCAAAAAAGLRIECVSESRIGIDIQGRDDSTADFCRRWHGLPLVLVVRARKP